MLFDSDTILAVTSYLSRRYPTSPLKLVVDPVMISTSGHVLLSPEAIDTLIKHLVPLAYVITPNIPEADALVRNGSKAGSAYTDFRIQTVGDMKQAALCLRDMGATNVLVKGGHKAFLWADVEEAVRGKEGSALLHLYKDREQLRLDGTKLAVDVLYCPSETQHQETTAQRSNGNGNGVATRAAFHFFVKPYLRDHTFHGTGCTLSAAIASELAKGETVPAAVSTARDYLQLAIENALSVGKGVDPLNHFHSIPALPSPPPPNDKLVVPPHEITLPNQTTTFADFLIASCRDEWDRYTNHRFANEIGQGTLSRDRFTYFIRQDYIFLKHYARCWALVAFKERRTEEVEKAAALAQAMAAEQNLHVKYCETWGISRHELEETHEALPNVAYTRYVCEKGVSGDLLDLRTALLPCVLGYGMVGKRLSQENGTRDAKENVFKTWIDTYAGKEYHVVVTACTESIDKLFLELQPGIRLPSVVDGRVELSTVPPRLIELCEVFRQATRLEIAFWDMLFEEELR